MKKLIYFAAFAVATAACTNAPETASNESAAAGSMPEIEVVEVSTNGTTADFSIEGMSCEMNCVSSVKSTLADMEGVTNIDFPDFSGDNDVNHGMVSFDAEKVTPEEMVAAIQKLYDGQYKVKHVKVEKGNGIETGGSPATEENVEEVAPAETAGAVSTSTSFEMPNLFDMFTKVF